MDELEAENARQREQLAALLARGAGVASPAGARTATTAASRPRSDGLGRKTKESAARRAARRRADSWAIEGRRCTWWRRPTRWWNIGRAVCAQLSDAAWTRRRWSCCASGARCTNCPPMRLRDHESIRRCTCAVPRCAAGERGRVPGRRRRAGRSMGHACGRWRSIWWSSNSCPMRGCAQLLRRPVRRAALAGHAACAGCSRRRQTLAAGGGAAQGGAAAQRRCCISDETGVRRGGPLAWAHVASTSSTHPLRRPRPARPARRPSAVGILPDFTGVSVHDGWKRLSRATRNCRHALCNIHHLRELTFLEEQYQQAWAKELEGAAAGR